MPTVLITGANRGLGLEFTRQYLAEGCKVIAVCRNPGAAHALQELERAAGGVLSVIEAAATGGSSSRSRADWARSPITAPGATFRIGPQRRRSTC